MTTDAQGLGDLGAAVDFGASSAATLVALTEGVGVGGHRGDRADADERGEACA